MEDIQTIAILIYLAGVIGCGIAADKRTCGLAGGLAFAIFCTPLVGAILILAWPGREEVAYYYWLKKREEKPAQ